MADPWADFDAIRHQIRNNTVDRLKHIANGLNEQCSAHIIKSGKKQDLIDRITTRMDGWKKAGHSDKWARARTIFTQVRDSGVYNRLGSLETASPSPSVYGAGPQSLNSYATSISPGKLNMSSTSGFAGSNSSGASIAKYDPYAPPRKVISGGPSSSSALSAPSKQIGIRFKPSPFLRVDQLVSSVVECPESTGTVDRRSQTVPFTLSQDQISKLRAGSPGYQLRLYCTSSVFYFSNPNAFRSSPGPCPIEFPPTCEVRINGSAVAANLKGLKKKPGTAPPAELPLRHLRLEPQALNKVEMVYVNSQQPIQAKKYYLVVFLVELTTVDQLVERLRKGKYRSLEEIKAQSFSHSTNDDDVVLGQQKLSLKCPLSYIRIDTPCRSQHCVHPQCFDARSWYQMMEQTTTWLCPVCEKELSNEDLIVDGYFQSILDEASDDVDDVLIETDGEWHTADNKHGSKRWCQVHLQKNRPTSESHVKPLTNPLLINFSVLPMVATSKTKVPQQVVSLCDSDDEDESFVKKELFASIPTLPPPPSGATSSKLSAAVIDLTLDSDSDESAAEDTRFRTAPSQSSSANGKRKERPDESYEYTQAPTPQRPRIDIPIKVAGGHSQHYTNGDDSTLSYSSRASTRPLESPSIGGIFYQSSTPPSMSGLYSPGAQLHPLPRRPTNLPFSTPNSYQICSYSPRRTSPGGDWRT